MLSRLIEVGLLIAETDLLTQVGQLSRTASRAPHSSAFINALGVITRNRPDSLHRCLTSYIENSKRYGRTHGFVVVDGSESFGTRNHIRQMLGEISTRDGVNIAYGGLEEKQRFAHALVATGDVPAEVVDFALFGAEGCGSTVGANRNALLLDTPGQLICSVDDDTVCQVAVAPQRQVGLGFSAGWDAMKFWFFPDRVSALGAARFEDADLMAIHEQLLGKDLRQCAATFASTVSASHTGWHFDDANADAIRDLQQDRGRVVATFTGIVGDSGIHTPINYLLLSGDSRQRLVRSETAYRSACSSREVIRVIDRPRLSVNAWCITTVYGFDNRELLPPFMPTGWGEDDLWGFTVQVCCAGGYFGYLPSMVVHAPPETRTYPPDSIENAAATLRNFQIVFTCIWSFQIHPGLVSNAERMHALGTHLMMLGEMKQSDFEEYVRLHLWRRQSEYITYLENLLRAYEAAPGFWADDVRRYTAALRGALSQTDYFTAGDLRINRRDDETRRLTQRLVRKFGLLLHWWPGLVTAAKTLRAEGRQLTAPL